MTNAKHTGPSPLAGLSDEADAYLTPADGMHSIGRELTGRAILAARAADLYHRAALASAEGRNHERDSITDTGLALPAPSASAANDGDGYPAAMARGILASAPRPVALVCSLTVAAWCRTLAALERVTEAADWAAADGPALDLTSNEGLARAVMLAAPKASAVAAARAATLHALDALAPIEDAPALWRALAAVWFAAAPAELAELRHGAEALDALAAVLDGFPSDAPASAAARAA